MKYQWNLYDLINNINILTDYYENTDDIESKQLTMEYIEMYRSMISLIIKKQNGTNNLLNDSIEYNNMDNLIQEQILSYQENDIDTLNTVLQSYLPFREVYAPNYILNEIPIIATNEDLITITKDFYRKMVPNHIYLDFEKALENKNNIHFSYAKTNDNYAGLTVIDPLLRKKYIYISRVNQLLDLVNLPHESFHYLFNDFDAYLSTAYNMYYTTEIEGSFANILFGDYFYQNAVEHKNYFHEYFLEVYHSGISELVVRNTFLKSLRNNKQLNMKKLNKHLEYWGLEPFTCKEELLDFITDPLEINIKYTLGYLVAIDLYYIYLEDPEFAFYLLKNLKFIKCENDIHGLFRRNHITFMDDGYSNFKRYIKKIEND